MNTTARKNATALIVLADARHGQTGSAFAVLDRKDRKDGARGPFYICQFKDETETLSAPVYGDSPLFEAAEGWVEKFAYYIQFKGEQSQSYGMQLKLTSARLATEDDRALGYEPERLFEQPRIPPEKALATIEKICTDKIKDEKLLALVENVLARLRTEFLRMPAAQGMHHPFLGGLVEHVRSVTRVAAWLGEHYDHYYGDLNPRIDVGLIVASAVLHDIGKLFELEIQGGGARYRTRGRLIGHIVMGRDVVREAAAQIEGFPEETLLRLEHSILSHHGKQEFGSPVLPSTIEAFILSAADDLDAKINEIVRGFEEHGVDQTGLTRKKVFALGRMIYRGVITPPDSEVDTQVDPDAAVEADVEPEVRHEPVPVSEVENDLGE